MFRAETNAIARKSHHKNRAKRLARLRAWTKNNHAYVLAAAKLRSHTPKGKARGILTDAVAHGRIIKPEHCEICKKPTLKSKLHGHHDDYSKPLEVRWMCLPCHADYHRREREGLLVCCTAVSEESAK